MQIQHFVDQIRAIDAALADSVMRVENGWRTDDPADAELTQQVVGALAAGIRDGLFSADTMVTGFKAFAHDFFERQGDCIRSGSYQAKDYEQVRQQVYGNDAYMATTYYPALLLSYIASPNYRHILRALREVLQGWQAAPVDRVVDIASGHGLLLLYALQALRQAQGLCIDLSPVAARFATRLQASTGWGAGRFDCATRDLMVDAPGDAEAPFDAAICCELLEHLPDPGAILQRIRGLVRPGGRLFVSAAVRMESIDHLTFFRTTGEVAALLQAAGFALLREFSVPFVTVRPSSEQRWNRLLADSTVPVTFIAECEAR